MCTKIYYTSRTHAQLSQVLHELEKLKLNLSPASIISLHGDQPPIASSTAHKSKRDHSELEEDKPHIDVRTVSLGSRKQLCIHEELKAKVLDLDEACRQLLGGQFTLLLDSV